MEHGEVILKPCRTCGRSFNPISLEKHEKICEASKKCTKRTVFKSFIQRSKEIDLVPVGKGEEKDKIKVKCREQNGKKINISWKLLNNGQSPSNTIPSGYLQCPSCNRHFNPKAADRHISWCREQKNRLPKTPPNAVALERLQARVKYQAPRPQKKSYSDGSIRLVKSAESVREPSHLRTHSSPPLHSNGVSRGSSSQNVCKQRESTLQNNSFPAMKRSSTFSNDDYSSMPNIQENETKKTVKFKEQFPIYLKDRNKNLDTLRILKLHLSQLSTSDDHFNNYILRSKEHEIHKSSPDIFSLPVVQERSYSKESHIGTNNNDDVYCDGKNDNVEKRMPKFCYNCGTKYPIANAKYCCECGVQRLVFGTSS